MAKMLLLFTLCASLIGLTGKMELSTYFAFSLYALLAIARMNAEDEFQNLIYVHPVVVQRIRTDRMVFVFVILLEVFLSRVIRSLC
jgi:hypothetical protein